MACITYLKRFGFGTVSSNSPSIFDNANSVVVRVVVVGPSGGGGGVGGCGAGGPPGAPTTTTGAGAGLFLSFKSAT